MNANYRRAHGYRIEEVGLRPRGNTVTVDVPSDNPFEDEELAGAPVTVVTQASGGVAKPQSNQRSRKLMYGGPKKGIPASAIKVAIARKNAAKPQRTTEAYGAGIFGLGADISARPTYAVAPRRTGGFMPGMGDLGGDFEDRAYAAFNKYDKDAATTNRDAYDSSSKKAYWEQYITDQDAKEAAKPGWASKLWGGAKEGAATGIEIAKTAVAQQQAKTEKSKADAAARQAGFQAKAAGASAAAQVQAAEAKTRSQTATTKWLVGGGIALAVIGVVAFLVLKPSAK
jgi:hypothetical protein